MKDKGIGEILLKLIFLNAFVMLMAQVLGVSMIASLCFYLSFVLVAGLWGLTSLNSFTKIDLALVSIAIISLTGLLLSFSKSAGGGFEPFKKYIMFISALMFFVTLYKIKVTEDYSRYIHFLNSAAVIVFLIVYFVRGEDNTLYNGILSDYLLFGLDNPNKTAMFLLSIAMMELARVFTVENRFNKTYHLVLFGIAVWFLCETESRNSLLSLIIFVIVILLTYLPLLKEFYKSKTAVLLCVLWPIIFAFGYMAFIDSSFMRDIFSFAVSEGKEIDSRIFIWEKSLELIEANPLFGSYFEMADYVGYTHMHNTHFDIAVSYGLVVLVLVCLILYAILKRFSSMEDPKARFYYFGFCSMLIVGMGESAMFIGGFGIFFFAGSFLLLCKNMSCRQALKGADYE